MSPADRLTLPGPKKLLALDGGGIRGALTIEVLAELEAMLRRETKHDSLLLGDYFDYIGGTSTGAIIAACLSSGMDIKRLRRFYEESGAEMFDKAGFSDRLHYDYRGEALARLLRAEFGDATLGSEALRGLLLLVLRNATTDSPWPLSNNPRARYNNTGDDNDNLRLPLWQVVRASTAAPTFFPPESIRVGKHDFLFVDGGVTVFNNPAFQLFLMATAKPYRVGWPTGEDRMLLVSVGTGYAPDANTTLHPDEMNLVYNARRVPAALMEAALHQQDTLCRMFGKCLCGDRIDRELGDLKERPLAEGGNLFTYMRYNAELSGAGLKRLGLDIEPTRVQRLDATDRDTIRSLQEIGKAVARQVDPSHFGGFF